jgi:hypothetical protein
MAQREITITGKCITVHKAIANPDFSSKTVLVTDTWDYVTMWLKRAHNTEALFYWNQARDFFQASLSLPNTSAPLTSYYCFLNAVKTLLSVKEGVHITESHGVDGRTTSNVAALNNEEITF